MAQKDGFQALLSSAWGVIGFMVVVGCGLLFFAVAVLFMFGVDISGISG